MSTLRIKLFIYVVAILSCFRIQAQDVQDSDKPKKKRAPEAGYFELGMRSTLSFFDHQSYTGIGYGAQFRIRPGGMVNTEWYADYLKTDIEGLGHRETGHIGWSAMIYPWHKKWTQKGINPYLIGGNCFDYSKVTANAVHTDSIKVSSKSRTRTTTAVQAGIGMSCQIGKQFNFSLSAQYMQHIGNDLHVEIVKPGTEHHNADYGQQRYLVIEDPHKKQVVLEGHLLITMSVNFLIADFAK